MIDFLACVTLKFAGWRPKKDNRAPLLYYVKLCASFQIHQGIQSGVKSETLNLSQNQRFFFTHLNFKFYRVHWKTIGHLFYTTLSFAHHFKAIGEFKLELQSGNAQFGSKSSTFCPVWPWNLKDDLGKQQSTSSVLLQALCISEFKQELQCGNAQSG